MRNCEFLKSKLISKIAFFIEFLSKVQTGVDEFPYWVECPENSIPAGALKGGRIGDETIYIGRAMHSGALTPGKNQIISVTINYFVNF